MSAADQIAERDLPNMLLAGPRGRRLLLEYALQSGLAKNPIAGSGTFRHAVVVAANGLSRTQGQIVSSGRGGRKLSGEASIEVAERLSVLELPDPTPELMREALAAAVDHARYWESFDGEDLLAEKPEMKSSLGSVAALIAASSESAWWITSTATKSQHSVLWDGTEPKRRLSKERTTHLATGENGGWWSSPSRNVPVSARSLFDGSPAGLWFVEDNLGWNRAESVSLLVPDDTRIFEIACADDWVELCVRFPRDVSEQMRDSWHRASTRDGRWLVPDWGQVAQQYDGVHLQVGAYLALAGSPIPIDGDPDAASMIAGWSPDETYWFTSRISYGQERSRWVLKEHGLGTVWQADLPKS